MALPRILVPSRQTLLVPGDGRGAGKRLIRRPDLRGLVSSIPSGRPLGDAEVDYDDLIIHQTYRTYEPDEPSKVRHLMYEMSQRDPGDSSYHHWWKAVRLCRLTRVPRYLRQAGSGGENMVFNQQRDLLAALREQDVMFCNIIAKSPTIPMIFAYGVQGVGDTAAAAQACADEAWAVLEFQLQGLFQQLEYTSLTVDEGEALARHQAEWDHVAVARGRPLPTGGSLGGAALLDGNRTDVESTLNQLEAFLRGMGDKSFMMSLLCAPVEPAVMMSAWNSLTQKLSAVRSEQQGSRTLNAGVGIPIGFGASHGDSSGDTHSSGISHGVGATDGLSESIADSVSRTDSVSAGQSFAEGHSASASLGHTAGVSAGVADTTNHSLTATDSVGVGHSVSEGVSVGHSQSEGMTLGQSVSDSISHGQSSGLTHTESVNQGVSVNQGQSVAFGESVGSNWNNSLGHSLAAGQNWSEGVTNSFAETIAQSGSFGSSSGDSRGMNGSQSWTEGWSGGGIPGMASANMSETGASGHNFGQTSSHNMGFGHTLSGSLTEGLSQSMGESLTQTASLGESWGGNRGQSLTATDSVGRTESVGIGSSLGATHTESVGQSQTAGQSIAASQTIGQTAAQSQTAGLSASQGQSLGQSVGAGRTLSQGESFAQSATQSVGTSATATQSASVSAAEGASRTATAGASQAQTANQSLSDAYMVAMSRTTQQTSSFGAVPSFGVAISKATFDEGKRILGDVLEAQRNRFLEGIESGGMLYQLFLVTPDRETLRGAAGLLKSAFWGPGTDTKRLPAPFHTIVDFEDDERRRLLDHARAFTPYRRREPETQLIEPHLYSTFVTPGEAAAFCHPPTAESLGIHAIIDSMPVLAMPTNRTNRELRLGHIINGERGKVSDVGYSIDSSEFTHTLIAGKTGSGKSTTMMRLLTELTRVNREIVERDINGAPAGRRVSRAGVLGLDWGTDMRDLASVVEPDRFRFFSVSNPALGAFRWNPLAIPDPDMGPVEWSNTVADNMTVSFNLAEVGRSLIAELLAELYGANRLVDNVLLDAVTAEDGTVLRAAHILPAVDPATLPEGAVQIGPGGEEIANVLTCPELSRLVGVSDLAVLVLRRVEELATPEGGRLAGTAMRDRVQSLWRRIQYFTPGSPLAELLAADTSLDERTTLGVEDLIDPDKGLVCIIEAEGLDLWHRRFILGSVLLAVWKRAQHAGEGSADHGGNGPGTYVCLEEAHELIGSIGEDEDKFAATTRTALYETMFRRARKYGLRLIAVVQNASALPTAIHSNVSTVFIHRQSADADRRVAFDLLNWDHAIAQQMREWRYLGEMPTGYCIGRLDSHTHYLESAPVQFLVEPPALTKVTDAALAQLARNRFAVHV